MQDFFLIFMRIFDFEKVLSFNLSFSKTTFKNSNKSTVYLINKLKLYRLVFFNQYMLLLSLFQLKELLKKWFHTNITYVSFPFYFQEIKL